MIVWLDGALLRAADATVSIRDRGFLFGEAVFETALLHDGGFFRLREHLDRFAASAAVLRIDAPPIAELDAIVRTVVRENALAAGNIRITLTGGVARPTLLVTATPPDEERNRRLRTRWRLITARTRHPPPSMLPSQLKSVGRVHSLLARIEAADAGADDALLLSAQGHICEGPTWNIFWRRGERLCTPAVEAGVLAGVTRSAVLQLAPAHGFETHEGLLDRSELDHADEIFATMSSAGIVPVRELDGRVLPAETPAADVLFPAYCALVAREAALDPV